jgi:hypothetical protein
VYGFGAPGASTADVHFYGTDTAESSCQNSCASDPFCMSYTWHDANQGAYANQCFGTDSNYKLTPQGGHNVGVKTS